MKTTTLKSLLVTAAALATLVFPACAPCRVGNFRAGNTPAAKIAKDRNIPGKGSYGQCLPYALALHQKFQEAGIPSRVIAYDYEILGTPVPMAGSDQPPVSAGARQGTRGAHAIVAYADDGRIYVTDNQTWMPQWVRNGPPAALARQFSGMDIDVSRATVVGRAGSAGDLSPAGLRAHGIRRH